MRFNDEVIKESRLQPILEEGGEAAAKGKNKTPQDKLKKDLEKKEEKKRKAKQPGIIDIYGEQRMGSKIIEGYSFFQDLNYGDMVFTFSNPFYDFQLKERQEIDMAEFNSKTTNVQKVQMSAAELKKREKDTAESVAKINEHYKVLATEEVKQNIRIDLQTAYEFFAKYLNLKPEHQIESR